MYHSLVCPQGHNYRGTTDGRTKSPCPVCANKGARGRSPARSSDDDGGSIGDAFGSIASGVADLCGDSGGDSGGGD